MKLFPNTSSYSFQAIVAACFVAFLVISGGGGSICAQAQELIFSDVGATDDWLGLRVAISGDGMYLAAGAPYDPNGDVNGTIDTEYVRLYARSGTEWNMIQQINRTRSNDDFGWSLDLSHDGSMLAISTLYDAVYMYKLSTSSFLYELVHTTDNIDAREISVSGDGMVVGVAFWSNRTARIYERIGDGFQQRGADILGYGYGGGIALNYDGTIAIVGDLFYDSDTAIHIGRAAVFQWRDDNEDGSMEWMQMGSDITGDAAGDRLGYDGCVSITYDGLTVAVGSAGYDRDGLPLRGLVRVYDHDSISDTWKQSGGDLVGDNAYDYFSKTALSADGTYLAVGARGTGDYVRLFAKNGTNYEAVGEMIIGEGGTFGESVDISADASTLVVGDNSFEGDSYNGKVYLYDTFLSSPTIPYTLAPTASSSLPPSLHESSTPTGSPTISPSFVTFTPSTVPSSSPSKVPSMNPTLDITNPPSKHASSPPTLKFSTQPSVVPSDVPSAVPVTSIPTASPTMAPTTADPTRVPQSSSMVSVLDTPSSSITTAKSSLICMLLLWMLL